MIGMQVFLAPFLPWIAPDMLPYLQRATMTKVWLIGWLIWVAACVSAANAKPADIDMAIAGPNNNRELEDHKLYRIKVTCSPRADLANRDMRTWLVSQSTAISHFILISDQLPQTDPAKDGDKLPDNAISIIPVYSFVGQKQRDNRSACSRSLVISGGQPLHLIASESYSKTNSPGTLTRVVYAVADLIPPLWSIFARQSIPADVSRKLSGVKQAQDPIKAILATLDKDENYTKSEEIHPGKYRIDTKYSKITIDVSMLPSIVGAKPSSLVKDFRKRLNTAPEKLKPDDLENSCSSIAVALGEAGFSQDADIPYALAYVAAKSVPKEKILECLTEDYALSAAKLSDDILWQWIPAKRRVGVADASTAYPPKENGIPSQPRFSYIEGKIYDLIVDLRRLAQKDSSAEGLLRALLQPKAILKDRTEAGLLPGGSDPADSLQIVGRLLDKGYRRFGCYVESTADMGKNVDGASVVFLAFNAGDNDKATTL